MATPTTASRASTATPRRRYVSTYVVAALAVAALVLTIAPGQAHKALNTWTHGWPWTYLTRRAEVDPARQPIFNPWHWTGEVVVFRAWPLITDIAIAGCVLGAVCIAWTWWRRQRHKVYQLHIRDLLALTTVVAIGCAWYVRTAQVCSVQHELATVHRAFADPWEDMPLTESALPSWLIQWIGSTAVPSLDHVVSPGSHQAANHLLDEPDDGQSRSHIELFMIDRPITEPVQTQLSSFPRLKALNILLPFDAPPSLHISERIPALPGLEGLLLFGYIDNRGTGQLETLTGLRDLTLYQFVLSDEEVNRIARMQQLRSLSLLLGEISPQGIRVICESLPELQSLNLNHVEVTDNDLAAIAKMPCLRFLGLDGLHITDAGLRQLEGMPALRRVLIRDRETITKDGIAALQAAMPQLRIDDVPPGPSVPILDLDK